MQENKDFKEFENDQSGQILPALADNTLITLAQQAEARIEAMGKIKRISLKLTNAHDWVDENGKPYLQASGAEKVARLFGISWRISEPTLENLEGGHFIYTYKGEFSLSGASIEAIGTRSSKDGFFKKYEWQGAGDNRKRIELPVSEIDRGDVKKAAYTNLLGNGITRLLGIRNLTYDDLKEYVGISQEQITTVQYKKGGSPPKPGGNPPTEKPKPEPTKPAPTAPPTAPPTSVILPETTAKPGAVGGTTNATDSMPTGKVVQNVAELKKLLMNHKIATNEAYEILNIKSFMDLVDLDDAWQKIKQVKGG